MLESLVDACPVEAALRGPRGTVATDGLEGIAEHLLQMIVPAGGGKNTTKTKPGCSKSDQLAVRFES